MIPRKNVTKLRWKSSGEIHLVKKEEVTKEEPAMTYWKLRTEEGMFMVFKESVNNEIEELIKTGGSIWVKGDIKIVPGGTYLIVTRIIQEGD